MSGRTPEERERARQQREARRAEGGRSAAQRRAAAKEYLRGGGRGRGRGRPGAGDRPPRRRSAAVLAVGGGLLVVVAAWFALSLFQPLKGDGAEQVTVTIPRGATVAQIADLLEERGVISSAFFFRMRATLAGRGGDFKAGEDIPMRLGMSHSAAMDALAEPPPPDTVTITIPEGLSRREAGHVLPDSLRGDYLAASRRSSVLDPTDYGAPRGAGLEGFLFPATYELEPDRPARALVERQLEAFAQAFEKVDLRYARRRSLTPYDVLIIASMVEREVSVPRERRLVASVIYNRLSQGIPLGIDATIRYATGNWSEPLKESELALDSPYNTRLEQGLPPGPIGSPGLAALRAAARPAETDYLYYVVKPCGQGEHAFSETDAEFQRDVARYNAERERQGGRSPTDC